MMTRPSDFFQNDIHGSLDILDTANVAFLTVDAEGRVLSVNRAAERLFGRSEVALRDGHLIDWIHADWHSAIRSILAEETPQIRTDPILDLMILPPYDPPRWARLVFGPRSPGHGRSGGYHVVGQDIGTQRRALDRMIEQRSLFSAMLESTSDMIFAKDLRGRYLYMNEATERYLKLSTDAVLGRTDEEIFGAEIAANFRASDQEVLRTNQPVMFENEIHEPGRHIRHHIIKYPLRQADGATAGVIGVARDITELMQAEAALHASEAYYRAIVEHQLHLICRFQPDMTLTYVNNRFSEVFNLPRAALIGQDMARLLGEQDAPRLDAYMAEAKGGGVSRATHTLQVADVLRWIEWQFIPIYDANDALVEYQAIGEDVTARYVVNLERQEYIQRLEIIQALDAQLTAQLDPEYVLEVGLEAAVRISGADAGAIHLVDGKRLRVAGVIGNFPASMKGSTIRLDEGLVGRAAQSGAAELVGDVSKDSGYLSNIAETRSQMTLPLTARGRRLGTLNIQSSKLNGFTETMFEFMKLLAARVSSALDNASLYGTTQQQLTELQGLYQQVSSLEQLKTQMIRVAAHDLRNPLGIISGYVQILTAELGEQLGERGKEHIAIINESIGRIDRIARNILTLERVAVGKALQTDPLDLVQLVRIGFEEARLEAVHKKLDYQLEIDQALMMVRGDRFLLPETISNLIGNAIKYTAAGGRVLVTLKLSGKKAVFRVEDTGCGIPEEFHNQLFQPFYRVKTKETRTIKGSGLGLHLVKSIIELHRGSVGFSSDYGVGSAFWFELPVIK